ncbi:hypothetical protein PENTCL1PPCAC_25631, partial [Pristionchus entomophagus]
CLFSVRGQLLHAPSSMCSILMCFVAANAQAAAVAAGGGAAAARMEKRRPMCCTITLIVLGVLLLALGLVLLIAFPISIFPALVKSQIPLIEKEDGSYTKLTGFWQNLPQLATYDFYFFNVTNEDEIIYEGAKPHLVEVGPYSYIETEFKEGIQWLDDNTRVYYRSNKTWVFHPENSCTGCTEADIVTLPNAAYATIMATKVQNYMASDKAKVLDLLLQIIGEGPMRSVNVGGMLFDAYDDPLLDVINSNLTKLLINIGGDGTLGGVPIPDVPYMGYFPHYNHTNDEDYVLRTGQDDPMMAFQIEKWAGQDKLSWWSGEAAEIKGAGDGTFYKPFIEDTDVLKNFQSFSCRAFDMEVSGHEKWTGIDATVFTFPDDTYDSNKEHNIGYRYENVEYIDYFPDWPTCKKDHVYQPWAIEGCEDVDCRFDYNFCSDCCDGSHYDRTIFMPPGIVPLRCFPGQNKRLPFAGFLSPPHFSASPHQVHDTMVGLHPDPDGKHQAGRWWINSVTGGTVHAIFNMQLAIPIYNDADFMMTTHMRNAFLPSFWTHIDANLKPYAHDFIQLSAQTVPIVAMALGWSFLVIALLFFIISFCCYRKAGRNKGGDEEVHQYSYNVTIEDEKAKVAAPVGQAADLERRRNSPAQLYPELYGKDSAEGSTASWKSKTLQKEGSTEAWS